MAHHAIALYVGKQLTSNMFVAMPILAIQLSLYICNMDMCKILLILNLFFRSIYFNVLKYLLFFNKFSQYTSLHFNLYLCKCLKSYIISIYFNQYTLHVLCIKKKKNYIYYTCMYYYIYLVLITLFYMYYCCHFKYSVCLLWFYVSLFYSRFVGK